MKGTTKLKTFRRYLMSYLAIMMLPIIILSFFIFKYLMTYCGNQILAHSGSTLKQLQTAVSIQLDQLDAMTLLTTARSEFFERNLKQSAGFYSVQRTLSQWEITNGFASDMYFYSTNGDRVYSSSSVYSLDKFFSAKLENYGISREDLDAALDRGQRGGCWLSSQPRMGAAGKVLYVSTVRASAAVDNIMIYEVDQSALDALAQNAMVYSEGRTLLCDEDGAPVYDTSVGDGMASQDVALLMAENIADSGSIRIEGVDMFYARLSEDGDGPLYFSLVPGAVANVPLIRLQNLFIVGLVCIFILGACLILVLMRITYKPLAELESDAKGAQLPMEYTDDMVANVRNALHTMKKSHMAIVDRVGELNKERLVLKLLTGCYRTLEDFNDDAGALGMGLNGDAWRILLMRFSDGSNTEDFAGRLTDAMERIFGRENPPLFLEIPENHSFVYIVSDVEFEDGRALEERLGQMDIAASVLASAACREPSELALAYARLLRSFAGRNAQEVTGQYPTELFNALIHSFQFGEKERIQFTLASMIEVLKDISSPADALCIAYDALHQAQLWLEAQEDGEGAISVRRVKGRLFDIGADAHRTARAALRDLAALLSERMVDKANAENSLVEDMRSFLEANYRNEDLTVQSTAEHYNLSISNLSHYFKKHVGVSVSEYIEGLRIQAAKELLRGTQMNVSDIALAVGYAYPATFMRAFKKVCGQSPTGYRKLEP